jgi:tetratricopeptide (TPR) repeat protein
MQRIVRSGVILAALAAFACGDAEKSKQEYVQQGEISLKNKDYAAAVVQLRNAVRADPNAGPARFSLAQAYEGAGQLRQAKEEYVRAADLLPADVQAQSDAARLLLQAGEFEDARTRAQAALKLDPTNAGAHLIRGRAAAGMNDLDGALKAFEDGITLQPGRSDLLVNRGQLRAVQGNPAEAEASFKQAVVVAPTSLEARLSLADFYWFSGKMAEAERVLKEAATLSDPTGRAARTLAAFYVSTNRVAEAEAPLKSAVAANPDPRLKLLLADFLAGTKRDREATPLLESLAKEPGTRGTATVRLAAIEFAKPGHGRAYGLLDELLKADPLNAEAISRKAEFLAADGKRAEAIAAAQAAIKADPEASPPHELLGRLYLDTHELQQAEAELKEALRLDNKAVRSMLMLASLNLTLQRLPEAVELAERALQAQPSNGEAQLVLVRALTAAGNVDRARAEIAKLRSDSVFVQVAIGDLEVRRGNKATAREAFLRAATMDPKSSEAQRGLLQLDAMDKKLDSAVKRIDTAVARNPGDAQMLLLAARTHMAARDYPNAESKALEALNKDPSLRPAYDLLGLMYRRQNRLEEAQKVFERVVAERPSDVPAHTMVGILQLVRGNEAAARERFEKVLSIDPRAPVASNNLAYIDAEAGTNLDVALNRAQTAKAALPDDPEVDDTLGWIYVKKGLPALAQNPLNEAVKKDGNNPLYLYHLGKAYAGMGDKQRAKSTLERALKLSSNFPGSSDATRTLASLGQ